MINFIQGSGPRFVFCFVYLFLANFKVFGQIKFHIKDSRSGQPIKEAVVSTSVAEYTADSTGKVVLPKAKLPLQLVIYHPLYSTFDTTINLLPTEVVIIHLKRNSSTLAEVEVNAEKSRASITQNLEAAPLAAVPSPFGDFSQAIAIAGMGVSANNEFGTGYQVRGGNFDENLIYVNGMPVYRPFLARAGQQEGLSFINPDLVGQVRFSAGGWGAHLGDRLSSVLEVDYRQPAAFKAGALVNLLGARAYIQSAPSESTGILLGMRYKDSRYLLNTLDTDGEYLPNFADVQLMVNHRLNSGTNITALAVLAQNNYLSTPRSRQTDFGTFNSPLRLNAILQGDEQLKYTTAQLGLRLRHPLGANAAADLVLSGVKTTERENQNLLAGYFLCQVDNNSASERFNECVRTIGTEDRFNYSRNKLNGTLANALSNFWWDVSATSTIEAGLQLEYQHFEDVLNEYTFTDSTGLINDLNRLSNTTETRTLLPSFYSQLKREPNSQLRYTVGMRATYNSRNSEWLLSPRAQVGWQPKVNLPLWVHFAAGIYGQPALFREMRTINGRFLENQKAQKSLHLISGITYDFMKWERPFQLRAEAYYKQLWQLVPYDINNVRLRYYAGLPATGAAAGIDMRLSGELVKGTQSWLNLSVLRTTEHLEESGRATARPTDQRFSLSIFIEDHLLNKPDMRVKLAQVYGSGLPYGPPGDLELRQSLRNGNSYFRTDVGLEKQLRGHKQAKKVNLWLGLDLLNLFGVSNTISFNWLTDYQGISYAVPNTLSQRFVSLRLTAIVADHHF